MYAAPLRCPLATDQRAPSYPAEKPTTGAALIAFLEKQPKFFGRRVILLNPTKVRLPTQSPIAGVGFVKLENGMQHHLIDLIAADVLILDRADLGAAEPSPLSSSSRASSGGSPTPAAVVASSRSSMAGPAIARPAAPGDARPLAQSSPAVGAAMAKPRPLSPLVIPKAAPAPAIPRDAAAAAVPKDPAKPAAPAAGDAAASPQKPAATTQADGTAPAPLSPRGGGAPSPDFGSLRRSQAAVPKAQVVTVSAVVQGPQQVSPRSLSSRTSITGSVPAATPNTVAPAAVPAVSGGAATLVTPAAATATATAPPSAQPALEESVKNSRKGFDALTRLLASPSAYYPLAWLSVCEPHTTQTLILARPPASSNLSPRLLQRPPMRRRCQQHLRGVTTSSPLAVPASQSAAARAPPRPRPPSPCLCGPHHPHRCRRPHPLHSRRRQRQAWRRWPRSSPL